jgi:broad specificity phosphatase PhoE
LIPTPEVRPWNLGSFAGQLIHEIVPFLSVLNERPDIPAPGGESWNKFYERYSRRLLALMDLAAGSKQSIAGVTHVRNFLTAPTVIKGGDKNKVPVKGGPPTGSVYVIEKLSGKWSLRPGQSALLRPTSVESSYPAAANEASVETKLAAA